MKKVLFVTSHLCSGSTELLKILNRNPRIQIKDLDRYYTSPADIEYLTREPHKLDNAAAIYGDHLLYNISLSSKVFYNFCDFVYVIREARPTLNEIIQKYQRYSEKTAFNYYCFRLRRIFEMARKTPGAVLLTWDDLKTGKGLSLMDDYLSLKDNLKADESLFNESERKDYPLDLANKAQDSYERYYFYMRNLDLRFTR